MKMDANPDITEEGQAKIKNVSLPSDITQVIFGESKRSADVLAVIKDRIRDIPIICSPVCDIRNPGAEILVWLSSLPDDTLLCVNSSFLKGIGYEKGVSGCIYRYDGTEVTPI